MDNSERQEAADDRDVADVDDVDQTMNDAVDDSSSVDTSVLGTSSINGIPRSRTGLMERLTDAFLGEGDGDLLLQQNGRGDGILQWLQALDMQVMGACRADERLKPLLKLNLSSDTVEDHLLVHLSQHFEPSEVGILARCLCVSLVSVRVGKINKQGTLLSPTAIRGNLHLTLLPNSDLRLSFIGDDGKAECLATLGCSSQCSAILIEEISTDKSGRSFFIETSGRKISYFWCSEKSKLLGNELLIKMKDLLERKPSLADLTGISESRLDCFASSLRAYLAGSSASTTQASSFMSVIPSSDTSLDSPDLSLTAQSLPASSRSLCLRRYRTQKMQSSAPYQGSHRTRLSSFKDGIPRNVPLEGVSEEMLKQQGEIPFSCKDNLLVTSLSTTDVRSSNLIGKDKFSEDTVTCLFPPCSFLESLVNSAEPPFLTPVSQTPTVNSTLLSPYYCWCPPIASTLQYTIAPQDLPMSAESQPLPPFSSLMASTSAINLAEVPSIDFPPLLPEPLVLLPLSMPNSQPIPTFTPLMCDPIVHIPVIDVCSSGEAYFVSAGPALPTAIPPLYPKLMSPLISETDSIVEEGARETLRLLISRSGSQSSHSLMDVFPPSLRTYEDKQNILAAGSRGLYVGSWDVGTISGCVKSTTLVSMPEWSEISGFGEKKRGSDLGDLVKQQEKPCDSSGLSSDDGKFPLPNFKKNGTD